MLVCQILSAKSNCQMRQNLHTNLSIFIVSILLSSCSYHIGSISSGSGIITNDEFYSIDYAYGTSRTLNVFGIGGNNKDALVLEAKRNLYLNSQMKPWQVIGQTTLDIKRTIFFPVIATKAVVSAEIIDFSTDLINAETTSENLENFVNGSVKNYFDFGQNVRFVYKKDTINAQIVDVGEEKCFVKFYDKNNNLRIKPIFTTTLISYQTGLEVIPSEKINVGDVRTPQNPTNKLVRFKHAGSSFVGELLEQKVTIT